MIKGIVEKVILSYFGKFIKGVEKDNLTVDLFGGNFKIENINLNEDFFNNLEVPIKLAYSSIGKLNMQVPLSKISSVPIECILDNIFIIFEFKDQSLAGVRNDLESRRKAMEKWAKECLQQFQTKLKDDKKEGGMMSKLGMKIIDNLQLKLVNLHIRFEDKTKDKRYAWGITLQEIVFITTDNQWKASFIDRQENRNATMFKTMDVKNLNLYWNSKDVSFLKNEQPALVQDRMAKIIYQKSEDKIISITSQFRLKINPLNNFKNPVYELDIRLDPLQVSLQQQQVSQVIDFLERLIIHNELKLMTKRKAQKIQNLVELQQVYSKFLGNLLAGDKNQIDEAQLEQVWIHLPDEQLMQLAIPLIKKIVKREKLSELEQKKKGWGWWGSSNVEISQDETKQLEQLVENAFQNEKQSIRPPSCLYFFASLMVPSGKFIFVKQSKEVKETVQFAYNKFDVSINKSEDESVLEVKLKLQAIKLDLFDYTDKDVKSINVLRNVGQGNNKNFMQLIHIKNVHKDYQHISTKMSVERVICVYRSLYLKKFREMFTFRSVDEIMKSATLEQFEKINKKEEDGQEVEDIPKLVQRKNFVELKIASPTLIIPFDSQLHSECWVWNFGNLRIDSVESPNTELTSNYQLYNLKLRDVSLQYYPSMQLVYSGQKNSDIFAVMRHMNFEVDYHLRKPLADAQKLHKSVLDIKLDEFGINFTEKQYKNLVHLGTLFSKQDKDRIEMLKKEKDQLWSAKSHEGLVKKRNETVQRWDEYYAVLSGAYLYFYKNSRQLKFIDKVYIKNSKVQISDGGLQISNRYQECVLKADTIRELEGWKDAIQDKIKEYATNVQLIELYEKEEQVVKKEVKFQKRSSFTFYCSVVYFTYENDSNGELMNCRIAQLKLTKQTETSQSRTSLGFQQLYIEDKIFTYEKSTYQPLIWIKSLDTSHPMILYYRNEEGVAKGLKSKSNIKMTVKLPFLQLNWKPDVLLVLLDLIKKYLKRNEESSLREDDFEMHTTGQNVISRQKIFENLYSNRRFMEVGQMFDSSEKNVKDDRMTYLTLEDYSKKQANLDVLLSIDVQLDNVDLYLMHRQTHVILFNITGEKILVGILLTEHEKFVDGSIEDMNIYEMTNYPQTENSNIEYEYIKPYKIVSRVADNKSKILKFRWSSYDQKHLPNKERVDSFLYLHASPIQYHYFQQVTFRMIDYTLIQIILLLTNPDMVVANENLWSQLEMNIQTSEKPISVWGQYEQIAMKLISPFFMDMYIVVDEPQVFLKAQPSSDVYFVANASSIKLSNKCQKNNRRFKTGNEQGVSERLLSYIWEEDTIIEGKDIDLKIIVQKGIKSDKQIEANRKPFEKPLWCPISLRMNVNRLVNEDEIKHIYPEAEGYDRGFYIDMESDEIRLDCDRSQYLQIMKLLNFNITYDDERDNLFIHNYKITKLLSPKPIIFTFKIPCLTLMAAYYHQRHIQTLFSVCFEPMLIKFKRGKDLNCQVVICTPQLSACSFKEHREYPILRCPETKTNDMTTRLDIEMKTNGTKIIMLSFESAKIVLKLNVFSLILEWVQVDDSIFPVPSSYVNEILFCTNINNVMIAWETQGKVKNALAALGTLSYKYSRRKNRTEEYFRDQLQKGLMTIDNINDLQESSYMSLSLNVQLLRCRYVDFVSNSFKKMQKRCLIYPVTFNFTQKMQLQVADMSKFLLKCSAKRNINIDRTVIKFSCKDLELVLSLMASNKKEEQYYKSVWMEVKNSTLETVGGANKHFLQTPSLKINNEISSLETVELHLESMTLIVVNNYGQSLVPVIQLTVSDVEIKRFATIKKCINTCSLICLFSYFNGSILKWEPVLQKTLVTLNYSSYYGDSGKSKDILTVQSSNDLYLSVSKQFTSTVMNTINQWNSSPKEQNYERVLQSEADEPIEFISHYIIINHTGYPLEIYDANLELKHYIDNGSKIDYNVELDNGQIQNKDVVINIRIVHPKLKIQPIRKINLNSNTVKRIFPVCEGLANFACALILRPTYAHCKQYFYVTSSLKIEDKTSSNKRETYMPFDQNLNAIQMDRPLKTYISIEKLRKGNLQLDHYRFTLTTEKSTYFNTITITHKYTAFNMLPVAVNINGVDLEPGHSLGFKGELIINGQKLGKTHYKTYTRKNEVIIYCQAFIVDYFGLDIVSDGKIISEKYRYPIKMKNQMANVCILPSESDKISLRVKGRQKFCKEFQAPLGHFFAQATDSEACCQFSLVSYLRPIDPDDKENQRFQKIIEITPRYVIVNSCNARIKVNQVDSLISTTLEPFERQPFFWESQKKPKNIRVSTFDEHSFWGYSGAISMNQNSQCFTLRKAQSPDLVRIFRCQLEPTDHITYINITEESTKFVLHNAVSDVIFTVFQQGILEAEEIINPECMIFKVLPGQTIPFGYEFPGSQKKLVNVGVHFLNQHMHKCYAEPLQVELESQLFTRRLYINRDGKRVGYYTIRLDFQGSTKKLSLVDKDADELIQDEPELEMQIRINKIGLSLIGQVASRRHELMYLQLDTILYEQVYTTQKVEYSLVVDKLRLENQREVKVLFPITLQSLSNPYLQFKLFRNRLNSKLVHFIGLSIGKSGIALTSDELRILYQNLNEWFKEEDNLNVKQSNLIVDYDFNAKELGKQEEKFYFVAAEVHPFKGNLSFKHVGDWGGRLFKTFSNISECRIKVDGIKINHFTCNNIQGFINQVVKHYKDNIMSTILPLIGNMSILGNPVSFAQRIGTGFKDMYELPADGFKQGAFEGGKGLARGARSLFQNTFQGAFGSVQAITDTIGTGLSSLVVDEQFEKERQKIRNDRSEHIFQGLWSGGKSIFNGLENGLKGVVTDPLEGAQKDGIGGFFLGSLKGLAGLVIKPVSGIIDATTKTAEGIKNTANYLNPKEREKKLKRIRNPRPFYNAQRQYRQFDSGLAEINFIIAMEEEKYDSLSWQSYYALQHKTFLLLSYEYTIIYNFELGKIIRQFESKHILRCEEDSVEPEKVVFTILKGQKDGILKISVGPNKRKLVADVKTIINYHHSGQR